MSWKRSSLADTGFFYDEDVQDADKDRFPPHVKSLEQAMLDFTCQELDLLTKKDLNIQCEAEKLANGGFLEDRWVDFFRKFFFNPLLRYASMSGGRSRINTNALWGIFDKNDQTNKVFKAPKPDLVFYLPMYHLDTCIPTITDPEAQQWHKTSTPSLVESFSWSNLKKLHGCGLLATPFNVLDKEEPYEQDLSCFPWLVVEYKKVKSEPGELGRLKEVAYCQAANASACAVKLNQNAAEYATKLAKDAEVPPVASVTTVGPQVKVWITFFARDFMGYRYDVNENQKFRHQEEGYMMQCIWTGDMTEPRDIIKFRLILENTYTWAKRVFKPLIATYIDQWKFACAQDITDDEKMRMKRGQERLELSRCALRLTQASLHAQPPLKSHEDSYISITNRLIDLCDRFVQDMDQLIKEEVKRSSGTKKRSSSSNTTRRRARTPSEPSRKATPESEDMTPLSVPRRSPRLEPRNKAQPSQEITSRVETVSSSLRVTMAAGAPKRRQSQSKYLVPPIEIELVPDSSSRESEVSGIVADEDISVANLSEEDK
ncbi:hypothetical protein BFJ68_g16462 [Fusarium oxysporum]|uniref:Uncharacterized protein n=1 Tax=Fusarium oxysporum TaxID=5507 RepID=A0A420PCY4_FUSOX|nr:hypothetical protein BFJ67_g16107 [Fusarium oxysporum f. sp. cepae]RKK32317.1 hypothetical protein BFJ66_g15429 [Fusarium oxysporum f. sp. cepae]RKK90396.1 hypothetical protein BFJ68_g16462 [Fusarium oxysporum]